jgi:hypothetical protein
VDDAVAGQDLSGGCLGAQPRRQVQRVASIARSDGDGLACVQADAHAEGNGRVRLRCLHESALQIDRRSDRRPRRREHREGLVPPEFEKRPPVLGYAVLGDPGELGGQPGGGLVAELLCELRVPANVGDQEGPDLRLSLVRLAIFAIRHSRRSSTTTDPTRRSIGGRGALGHPRGAIAGSVEGSHSAEKYTFLTSV